MRRRGGRPLDRGHRGRLPSSNGKQRSARTKPVDSSSLLLELLAVASETVVIVNKGIKEGSDVFTIPGDSAIDAAITTKSGTCFVTWR